VSKALKIVRKKEKDGEQRGVGVLGKEETVFYLKGIKTLETISG